MNNIFPLHKGDVVCVVPDDGDVCQVTKVGPAGFTVRGHATVYRWHNRGKTWTSVRLDRLDAAKLELDKAAPPQQIEEGKP